MADVLRVDYIGEGLSEAEVAPTPYQQVSRWLSDAVERSQVLADVPEPLALSVATVDALGRPNVRTVLMRFFDERGPGFVTNTESTKGTEIAASGGMAAALTWPALYRAIRFRGTAQALGRDEVTAYFGSRPWGSRISAWASHQSQPIAGAPSSRRRSSGMPRSCPTMGGPTTCRFRISGAGTGWCATRSSSGVAGGTACTTGWSSAGSRRGRWTTPAAWALSRLQP